MARECYSALLSDSLQEEAMIVNEKKVKAKKTSPIAKPTEDLLELPLDDLTPNQKVRIGSLLEPIQRKKMTELLRRHRDIFA